LINFTLYSRRVITRKDSFLIDVGIWLKQAALDAPDPDDPKLTGLQYPVPDPYRTILIKI
jgi:hypothetical protein